MTTNLHGDDIIDSRAVERRIEDLRDQISWPLFDVLSKQQAEMMDRQAHLAAILDKGFRRHIEHHPMSDRTFNDWLEDVISDENSQLFLFAKEHGAISKILGGLVDEPIIDLENSKTLLDLVLPEETEGLRQELLELLEFRNEAMKYATDWYHGVSLVREGHFPEYIKRREIEMNPDKDYDAWPLNCIDWQAAAEKVSSDYVELSLGGTTYFLQA